MPVCRKCLETKSVSDFDRYSLRRNATVGLCKVCGARAARKRYADNLEKARTYHRERYREKASVDPANYRPCDGEMEAWIRKHLDHTGDECLLWPYGLTQTGYPSRVQWKGKQEKGHRLMCILAHGSPTRKRPYAAHSCGNAACINPKHLRWATAQENAHDKIAHGTSNRGEASSNSVLKESQVLSIFHDPRRNADIAREYKISPTSVSRIKSGNSWAWLTAETQ